MENTKLWQQAFVTDPAAVKAITGKQYKGNSPKPYWIIQRATEIFGPCGIGWGIEVLDERIEKFPDDTALHIARVRVWYEWQGKRGTIEQMGQTKAAYKSQKGYLVDEDAPKKSVTDAMVKCLSMIGFAGDIFSGRWDDSNYVEWAQAETERRNDPSISDEQAQALKTLLMETDTDTAKFLQWLSGKTEVNVPNIDAMPSSIFARAESALKAKVKKKEPAHEPA